MTTEHRFDRLRVLVHPDPETLADVAAGQAIATMIDAIEERGVVNVMFATGNSQIAFIERLVARADDVRWSAAVVFHMDEYVGAGPDHPAGFQRWIRERIVDRLQPGRAHYLNGTDDPRSEAERYAGLLSRHPLDVCCLGIGENGHLAFNDPPVADFADPVDVKVVELDRECRQQQVDEGHFPDLDSVPPRAMTVTIPTLLRAPTLLAMVPERRKATPVRRALTGPIDPSCPASVLRRHPNATLHLDPGSASAIAAELAAQRSDDPPSQRSRNP